MAATGLDCSALSSRDSLLGAVKLASSRQWPQPGEGHMRPPPAPSQQLSMVGPEGWPFRPTVGLFWRSVFALQPHSSGHAFSQCEPLPSRCSLLPSFPSWSASPPAHSGSLILYPLQDSLPVTLLHVQFHHGVCLSEHLNWYNDQQCYFVLVFIRFQRREHCCRYIKFYECWATVYF